MAHRGTLLLIEGESATYTFIREFLAEEGYTIHLAHNAPAGITALADLAPDAILCALNLPRANGLQFVRAVRSLGIETPIILMTTDTHVEMPLADVSHYLLKPFTLTELLESVEHCLHPPSERSVGA